MSPEDRPVQPHEPAVPGHSRATPAEPRHLIQRLILTDLHLKRRASDTGRYVETLRRSTVDPNPHQIEAVAFALERLEDGGALLCDEVGLGKTIETGLLLTQLRAEGRSHILIVVPVPLARQWQIELLDRFGLKSTVLGREGLASHLEPGIYIVGRELAGSPRWAPRLARQKWSLVVIDEAHEMLGGLHRRFNKRTGAYQTDVTKGKARRAGYLREVVGRSPAILLTATPLQNNLYELWSLASFVDQDSVALGEIHEFSRLFCADKGRSLKEGVEEEVRLRLQGVLYRTLRRDAQPFLRTPFTARKCETINFNMSVAERDLYEAVSVWLDSSVAAYRPQNRRLIALQLRRRMGSSVQALSSTLAAIRRRLEIGDLRSDDEFTPEQKDIEEDLREVKRLEALAQIAIQGPCPKLACLLKLTEQLSAGAIKGIGSDKVVVFTESKKTLQSVVRYLEQSGLAGQVTAFSGTNDTPEAQRALRRWEKDVGAYLEPTQRPEQSSAMRAALIHEFRTRTRVLVATEAGAKGLNLQFCNCVVNYDLPWNPQRVEQRIGRVHRYGQPHDVTVVNFINRDNEGEARVYQLLKNKLKLFDGLFGASDPILGQIVSTLDLERRIEQLFLSCRTPEERDQEFDRIELAIDAQSRQVRDARLERARSLIASLHEDVQARLRTTNEEIPQATSRRDSSILRLLETESPVTERAQDADRLVFTWRGRRYHLGPPNPGDECGEPIDLTHPILHEIDFATRSSVEGRSFIGPAPSDRSSPSASEWHVYRVTLEGLEVEERLVTLGPEGQDGLERALAEMPELRPLDTSSPDPSGLAPLLDRMRDESEDLQESTVRSRLERLAARREDARRWLEDEEARLQRALTDAERARSTARTVEGLRSARTSAERFRTQLENLQEGREERLWEGSRELRDREDDLHRRSNVRIEAQHLFSLYLEGSES